MNLIPVCNTSFGYSHKLKTLWKKGMLPSVKYGLYGDILTPKNISLDHLFPHSQGGHTVLSNLALASKSKNNARGSESLNNYLTPEQAKRYLNQFLDIHLPDFNGNYYIMRVTKTLQHLGINL